jgi:DNA-directed RNA polymerase beta subunit
MQDFNTAIAALTLEDVADPYSATTKLIGDIGETWPKLKKSERRADVIGLVEKTKLDLLIAKAKDLPDDEGIRLLIEEQVAPEVITSALDITAEKLEQVRTEMEKERAERTRVTTLLEAVEGKSNEEKVKHLFNNDVSEELIIEMAKVDQDAINSVKQAMEAELKEKQKLEEEAAARKAAQKKEAAAGPPLEEIPPDEMLEHIEAIREIMEFSDQEKEIRVMCEQSSIPTCLVDIAVSEPDRLDELEKEAEG